MASRAHLGHPKGKIVEASTVSVSQSERYHFYCATPGCNAEMICVNAGDPQRAFFRSVNSKTHASPQCLLPETEQEYDESKFFVKDTFKAIITDKKLYAKSKRIRSVEALYSVCQKVGKDGRYNGFRISDILADSENYERYKTGVLGYKLVETSYYHKVKDELALRMNFPAENKGMESWVKLEFEDKDLFWSIYNRLKEISHFTRILVAGDWVPSEEEGYHSKCKIETAKQIWIGG